MLFISRLPSVRDDANVGRNYDLPFVQLVDAKGEMTKETPWAGTFCKEADPIILKELAAADLLFSAPKFETQLPLLLEMRHAADSIMRESPGSSR